MNFQILRVDLPDAEGHHTFITYTLKTILRHHRGRKSIKIVATMNVQSLGD